LGEATRRREFITVLGAAAAWPLAARGQQPGIPLVGYFSSNSASAVSKLADSVREGLAATGFVEGKDFSIEYRWADRHPERLPALALDLIQRRASVVVAVGNAVLRAVRSATQTVPIVAVDLNSDPVESGMAASFAHPGGNVTGIFLAFPEFATKWMDMLREAIPQLSRVATLWDPSTGPLQKRAVENAANLLKVSVEILEVQTPSDFDEAFRSASRRRADAVLMLGSPLVLAVLQKASELALLNNLPTFYWASDFPRAGGLMSYGPNLPDTFYKAGVMVGKIL
jgi:putative tryptophan/tyrosine transport system substrate-binding protein